MSDSTELIGTEPPKEGQTGKGSISKLFYEFTMDNIHEYSRALEDVHRIKNIRYCNQEYVPLYGINFKPDYQLPASMIKNGTFEMSTYEKLMAQKTGTGSWQSNTVYTSFIKKAIQTEQYNAVLFLNHKIDSVVTSAEQLKTNLKGRFDTYVTSPINLDIHREGRSSAKNYLEIIENCKYYNGWGKSRTRRVSADAPSLHFLTNFYYMAKLNQVGTNFWIEPMFSVMVRREHVPYIRACMITNTPIPVDMLELWIDRKLDAVDSSYKIRPTFIKYIKTPFTKAGVKVVVHDNMFDVMYTRLKLPKFRNIMERAQWTKQLTTLLISKEKASLGISPPVTGRTTLFEFGTKGVTAQTIDTSAALKEKAEEFDESLNKLFL